MPPKRHIFDAQESAAARWKRLCLTWTPPAAAKVNPDNSPVIMEMGTHTRGSKRPAPATTSSASHLVTRPDAPPVVRHTRRGTTAAAVSALAAFGSIALVEALLENRYAKSASSTMATLAATWGYFHDQAFAQEVPLMPYLPITVRILVMVGSLSKAAG